MVEQKFGHEWSQRKLHCVKDYLAGWTAMMEFNSRRFGWKTRYIDAFSGTGSFEIKATKSPTPLFDKVENDEEKREIQQGSARIAIEHKPKFDRIDLIELDPEKANELRKIAGEELGSRVFVHEGDANSVLEDLCLNIDKNERAVLFLDPFGCQVWWETLQAVAKTKRIDIWYLFSIMGVNRKLPKRPEDIPDHERTILNKCLGTNDWENQFYQQQLEQDLFGEVPVTTRLAKPSKIEEYFKNKLGTIFPFVSSDCLRLKSSRNGHIFSLFFAISNPSEAAMKRAIKLVTPILKKWEKSDVRN